MSREECQRYEPQVDADRQSLDASVESARCETFGALAGSILTSYQFRCLPQPKCGSRLAIEMPNNKKAVFDAAIKAAETDCLESRLFRAEISVDARLVASLEQEGGLTGRKLGSWDLVTWPEKKMTVRNFRKSTDCGVGAILCTLEVRP